MHLFKTHSPFWERCVEVALMLETAAATGHAHRRALLAETRLQLAPNGDRR